MSGGPKANICAGGVGVCNEIPEATPATFSGWDSVTDALTKHPTSGVRHRGVVDPQAMLDIAIQEARLGLAEGGIPIGGALFHKDGTLLGQGHNRRIQENDPSVHGETDAFRKAGRQRRYQDTIMVTTLAPCWYCSGLIRQFRIMTLIVGESRTFRGGIDWLREHGVSVIDLGSAECERLLASFIERHPDVWNEDIGECEAQP